MFLEEYKKKERKKNEREISSIHMIPIPKSQCAIKMYTNFVLLFTYSLVRDSSKHAQSKRTERFFRLFLLYQLKKESLINLNIKFI